MQFTPQYHRGHFGGGGGLGGHKFKFGKATKRMDRLTPNSVQVCGFIWEWTSRLKQFAPRYPTAAFEAGGGGGLGCQQFKSLGKVAKRLDRLGINIANIIQVNLGMDKC